MRRAEMVISLILLFASGGCALLHPSSFITQYRDYQEVGEDIEIDRVSNTVGVGQVLPVSDEYVNVQLVKGNMCTYSRTDQIRVQAYTVNRPPSDYHVWLGMLGLTSAVTFSIAALAIGGDPARGEWRDPKAAGISALIGLGTLAVAGIEHAIMGSRPDEEYVTLPRTQDPVTHLTTRACHKEATVPVADVVGEIAYVGADRKPALYLFKTDARGYFNAPRLGSVFIDVKGVTTEWVAALMYERPRSGPMDTKELRSPDISSEVWTEIKRREDETGITRDNEKKREKERVRVLVRDQERARAKSAQEQDYPRPQKAPGYTKY